MRQKVETGVGRPNDKAQVGVSWMPAAPSLGNPKTNCGFVLLTPLVT